jgi:hypothetical protein
MRTYAGAKSLDSQENATSTPVANKEGKGTLRPECAHFETEQKPSQNGRYLRCACGSRVSLYRQRAEENPRNSTLQDVRSPGSRRWTVPGQVKVETNIFSKAFRAAWYFARRRLLTERCPTHCQMTASYRSQRPAIL